jgi:dTDP-N-acetylfucosamine:lipid II N-acetylfucosaminyltransferase
MENPSSSAIIHLLSEAKFLEPIYQQMEHYYPGRNYYFVHRESQGENGIPWVQRPNLHYFHFLRHQDWKEAKALLKDVDFGHLMIHFLDTEKAAWVLKLWALQTNRKVHTYWIFYGADLYKRLPGGMPALMDQPPQPMASLWSFDFIRRMYLSVSYWLLVGQRGKNAVAAVMANLDFFCTWDQSDFTLFTKHFKTRARFKELIQLNSLQRKLPPLADPEGQTYIQVNHSASPWGNHLTLLKRLKDLGALPPQRQLLLPMSYGEAWVKREVKDWMALHFPSEYRILDDFLPRQMYFSLGEKVETLLLGANRQEGAGNVFNLLAYGTKIFMREKNGMLSFLRSNGFLVFSIEEDLKSVDDLLGLDRNQKQHNQKAYSAFFEQQRIDSFMQQLLEEP